MGIPIGNLTSQFFANLYLDDLDHFVKQQLNVRPYLRYVDDMVVLDNDKIRACGNPSAVRCTARRPTGFAFTLTRRTSRACRDGLNLLGYFIYPDRRLLRNDNGHRFARRLRALANGYCCRLCAMVRNNSADPELDRPCEARRYRPIA